MELVKITRRHRCGLGLCKNIAAHAVTFGRVGARGNLYICPRCMTELTALFLKNTVPKSPPNFLDPDKKYTVKAPADSAAESEIKQEKTKEQ